MARTAAIPSVVVVVVVVSSLFFLSLARRTVDQLPGGAEGSASPLPTLDRPHHLLTPNGESDPSVADRDQYDGRTNLQAAKPVEEEEEDPAAPALSALAVAAADRRPPLRSFLICLLGGCGNEGTEAPRGGDAGALPGAAMEEGARGGSGEAERAVAGAEAKRSAAEAMGWAPKRGEGEEEWGGEGGEGAKRRGKKKPRDSDSDSDSDSDDDDDDDDEEEEEEGRRKMKKKKMMMKKKGKRGLLKWFWRLVNSS